MIEDPEMVGASRATCRESGKQENRARFLRRIEKRKPTMLDSIVRKEDRSPINASSSSTVSKTGPR